MGSTNLYELYDEYFIKRGDPRVESWPFMKDPFSVIVIVAIYLYGVYVYMPNYMKHKKPYDLKTVLQVYNVLQVFACSYLIYSMFKGGWTEYSLGCQVIDYSNSKTATDMIHGVYFAFYLKMAELVETLFFCLRKKYNQISFLHVYHHCSTLMFAWLTCKYLGGGMVTFTFIINSLVHIVMYTYYFISALGPPYSEKVAWIKPKITTMQMIQFLIISAHSMQGFQKDCTVPTWIAFIYLPNMAILFTFFLNFYLKSYRNSKRGATKVE